MLMAAEYQKASRAVAAVLGAHIADAAAAPSHWVYDPSKMKECLEKANRGPAFMDPPGNSFYKVSSSGLSCYGEQAFVLLASLAEVGRFDVADFTQRLAAAFGRESEYEVKGYVDEDKWPQLIKGVQLPLPGPWRHGSIKGFLNNYVTEGKRYPECGSDDEQIDAACRIVPLVALYAGDAELPKYTEMAIRAVQNTDGAVKWGMAFARCLELLITGKADMPSEAIKSVVDSLRKSDPDDPVVSHFEAVLDDLAGMSLADVGKSLKPKQATFPFAGLA